ncbi:signal transduction histidine kinase [Actinomadura verrucosospora]|uniref:histidine kinase n=1 Tax=Actinomadura verrucosospora TaxID=46165 RepID=A0A7D3VQQ4_ACTVE|nr:ATP-binding protein [Actinomadura verrucosospora]QKG18454.1 signal transduction histidine kinase [Actinomadura verrucosospora]
MRSVAVRAPLRAPSWFGARLRRAAAGGAAVAAAALAAGWPYWRDRPAAAAVALACCGGFAVAGGVLAAGRLGRRTGAAFTTGAAAWALTWAASWNAGAGPVVSVFAQSVFFVAIGVGVLLYPDGRLDGAVARLWTGAATVVMIGGQALLCALSRPEWNGFAASAVWPSAAPGREAFGCAYRAVTAVEAVLAGALVIILLLRLPGTGRLDRRYTVPVAAAVTVGVAGALAVQGSLIGGDVTLDDVLEVYLFQGVSATVLPLAFLAAALRARLAELSAAERMHRLTDPVSAEKVRDALRRVLRDGALDLWLWAEDGYVDVTGRRVPAAGGPAPGRWRHEVRTSAGEPLAAVDADDRLRGHEPLVEAALVAGGRALETVRLQAAARANLERARDARERLVRVQAAERERLAAELQRSAQQRLRALEALLEGLEAAANHPAREQARACRRELAEAADELDGLARGVHPAILTDAGLAAAMRLVAARAATPVRLDLPGRRYPPEIESTLYFALCEALANAAKHAGAEEIAVSVRDEAGRVVAEVRDDGAGGAGAVPGGGLAGLTDRVRALRGHVDVDSPPDGGTTVRITLPAPR